MQKVIAIVGPTASGKTALSIALAKKFNGEIISADSRQVYRGLDIGTGKITSREMRGVPHHLIDIMDPQRQFSAGAFVKKAEAALAIIRRNRRVPIVVGGTGFYIDALLSDLVLPDVVPNKKLRKTLEKKTAAQLFSQLRRLDPRRAKEIDPYNKVRLIRAIEVAKALGSVPVLKRRPRYNVLWIGISFPKKKLEHLIHDRLRKRMRRGMVAEAKRLHMKGLSLKRMDELGLEYRFLARHLSGELSRAQMEEQLERAIRLYAKRQMRWLKRNEKIIWVKKTREAFNLTKRFLI